MYKYSCVKNNLRTEQIQCEEVKFWTTQNQCAVLQLDIGEKNKSESLYLVWLLAIFGLVWFCLAIFIKTIDSMLISFVFSYFWIPRQYFVYINVILYSILFVDIWPVGRYKNKLKSTEIQNEKILLFLVSYCVASLLD